jgi:hypothetical protein
MMGIYESKLSAKVKNRNEPTFFAGTYYHPWSDVDRRVSLDIAK